MAMFNLRRPFRYRGSSGGLPPRTCWMAASACALASAVKTWPWLFRTDSRSSKSTSAWRKKNWTVQCCPIRCIPKTSQIYGIFWGKMMINHDKAHCWVSNWTVLLDSNLTLLCILGCLWQISTKKQFQGSSHELNMLIILFFHATW